MNKQPNWKQSRLALVLYNFLALLVCFTLLRIALLCFFHPQPMVGAGDVLKAFLIGLHLDVFVALAFNIPLLFWFAVIPDRFFRSGFHRFIFKGAFFLFWCVQIFLMFAEYYFFEEFKSRFNTVAVDYLQYPSEVFVNIWDSYPVVPIISICCVLALVLLVAIHFVTKPIWNSTSRLGSRSAAFGVGLVLVVGLWFSFKANESRFGNERVINEIANNGTVAFFTAAWTHNLDYSAYYRTIDTGEAFTRTRRLLAEPQSSFVSTNSIQRRVASGPDKPRYNLVLFLEESLGSEFWGCLGRTNTLTPEMDKLALNEGMLFTNLYASGNRTVRGFEGVLSSFPPLPGDSIVKRDKSDNVETIARILKRDGYNTVFMYGGRGLFDGMRAFAVNNGYDKFVEQKHFDNPTFTTIWGVCDEDLYARAINEFRAMAQTGQPFFGTILSVSNHKPFTYPKGRIAEDPEQRTRENAVKYSDWCLGKFFRDVKQEAFYTNTIFVVVADHGARVYGSQDIPIFSYEIPLVILGPAVIKEPSRIPYLGCSLDVSPTILGMLGRPYETMFFGRDLLNSPPEDGRVMINHNRDIGMMRGDRMVVLSMFKGAEFYHGNPKVAEIQRVKQPDPEDLELEKDAESLYQIADDLYTHERYRVNLSEPPREGP